MALENIGSTKLSMGDVAGARAALRRALESNPRSARAEVGLGAVEMAAGNRDAAFAQWRRAVELDPSDLEALDNLATGLAAAGRRDEARPYAEAFARQAPPARFARELSELGPLQALALAVRGDARRRMFSAWSAWSAAKISIHGSSPRPGSSGRPGARGKRRRAAGSAGLSFRSRDSPARRSRARLRWTSRPRPSCRRNRDRRGRPAASNPVLSTHRRAVRPLRRRRASDDRGRGLDEPGRAARHLYVLIFDQHHIEAGHEQRARSRPNGFSAPASDGAIAWLSTRCQDQVRRSISPATLTARQASSSRSAAASNGWRRAPLERCGSMRHTKSAAATRTS